MAGGVTHEMEGGGSENSDERGKGRLGRERGNRLLESRLLPQKVRKKKGGKEGEGEVAEGDKKGERESSRGCVGPLELLTTFLCSFLV